MVFEGWVVDHLSAWLGHFFDLQRDQLRISLWRAWQTGVTLENIPIRLDALEYLQLPFRLTAGNIGRLQLQIPWQALRSPLILEVADARLEACLRGPEELWQEPAEARAWAGKEARLAGVEASALAGPEGAQESATAVPAPSQGSTGLLWGALSSLASFLVNRLQIRFTNDPGTGLGVEVRLPSVHTCSPSVALRMLGAALDEALGQEGDDPGMVHKDVALAAVSVWLLQGEPGVGTDANGWGEVGATSLGIDPTQAPLGPLPLLPPCDGVLHMGTTAALSNGTLRADCTLTLPSLRLSLSDATLAGVVCLADAAERVSRQNRAALFCPASWRLKSGGREGFARRMWVFALNGVLRSDARWDAGVTAWVPAHKRAERRKRYIRLYRAVLERPVQPAAGVGAAKGSGGGDDAVEEPCCSMLEAAERKLCLPDITLCRAVAARMAAASLAKAAAAAKRKKTGPKAVPSPGQLLLAAAGPASDEKGLIGADLAPAGLRGAAMPEEGAPPTRDDTRTEEGLSVPPADAMTAASALATAAAGSVPEAALRPGNPGSELPRPGAEGDGVPVSVGTPEQVLALSTRPVSPHAAARRGVVSRGVSAMAGFFGALPRRAGYAQPPRPAPPDEEEAARLLAAMEVDTVDESREVSHHGAAGLRASLRLRIPAASLALAARGRSLALLEAQGLRAAAAYDLAGAELAASLSCTRVRLFDCGAGAPQSLLLCGAGADEGGAFDPGPARGAALTVRYVRGRAGPAAGEAAVGPTEVWLRPGTLLALGRLAPPPGPFAAERAAADAALGWRGAEALGRARLAGLGPPVAWSVQLAGVDARLALGARRCLLLSAGQLAARSTAAVVMGEASDAGVDDAGFLDQHRGVGPSHATAASVPWRWSVRRVALIVQEWEEGGAVFRPTQPPVLQPTTMQGDLCVPRTPNVKAPALSIEARGWSFSLGTRLLAEIQAALQVPTQARAPPVQGMQGASGGARGDAGAVPPLAAGRDAGSEIESDNPCRTRLVLSLQRVSCAVAFDAAEAGPAPFATRGGAGTRASRGGPPPAAPAAQSPLLCLRLGSGVLGLALGASGEANLGASLLDLTLQDQTAPGSGLLPPPVVDRGAWRVSPRVTLARLDLDFSRDAGAAPRTATTVRLHDAASAAYRDEPGNFIARLHRGRPNAGVITVVENAAHLHVGVALNNVLLGHAALMRILLLTLPDTGVGPEEVVGSVAEDALRGGAGGGVDVGGTEVAPAPRHSTAAPAQTLPVQSESFTLDLEECVAEWRYQPGGTAAARLAPAALDFLLTHGVLGVLEAPRCVLRFPLDEPGERVALRGAALSCATLGVGGRALLPLLRLPEVALTVERAGGGAPPRLTLGAGDVLAGLHPSQITMAAAAAELFAAELAALRRPNLVDLPASSSDGARLGAESSSPRSMSDLLGVAQARTPLTLAARREPGSLAAPVATPSLGRVPLVADGTTPIATHQPPQPPRWLLSLEACSARLTIAEVRLQLLGPNVSCAGLEGRWRRIEVVLDGAPGPGARRRLELGFETLDVSLLRPLPDQATPFAAAAALRVSSDGRRSPGGGVASPEGEEEAGGAWQSGPGSGWDRGIESHAGWASPPEVTGPCRASESTNQFPADASDEGEVFYEALSRSQRRSSAGTSAAASRYFSAGGSVDSEGASTLQLDPGPAWVEEGGAESPLGPSPRIASPPPLAVTAPQLLWRLGSGGGGGVPNGETRCTAALHARLARDILIGGEVTLVVPVLAVHATADVGAWEEAAACVLNHVGLMGGALPDLRALVTAEENSAGGDAGDPVGTSEPGDTGPSTAYPLRWHVRCACLRATLVCNAEESGPGSAPPSPFHSVRMADRHSGEVQSWRGPILALTLQASLEAEARVGADVGLAAVTKTEAGAIADAAPEAAWWLQLRVPGLLLSAGLGSAVSDAEEREHGAAPSLSLGAGLAGIAGFELRCVGPVAPRPDGPDRQALPVLDAEPIAKEEEGQAPGAALLTSIVSSAQSAEPPGPTPQSPEEPPGSSAHAVQVDLALARGSVWLSQETAGVALALTQALTLLAHRLQAQAAEAAPHGGAARRAARDKGDAKALTAWELRARAGILAVLVGVGGVDGVGRGRCPLLQAAAHDLKACVGSGTATAQLGCRLEVRSWAPQLAGWEPVVEPWQVRLALRGALESAGPGPTPPLSLSLESDDLLELTASEGGVAAAARALQSYAFLSTLTLAGAGEAVRAAQAAAGEPALAGGWTLVNATGASVELWMGGLVGGGAAEAGPVGWSGTSGRRDMIAPERPHLTVIPGERVDLPVWPGSDDTLADLAAGYAGYPDPMLGVRPAGWRGDMTGCSPDPSDPPCPPRHTRVYFRGSGGTAGCVPLAAPGTHTYGGPWPGAGGQVPGSRGDGAPQPRVLASVARGPDPWAGTSVVLHSGLRLVNRGGVALEVRLHTPLGFVAEASPRASLGALQPGQGLWLPVQHALLSALSFRPLAVGGCHGAGHDGHHQGGTHGGTVSRTGSGVLFSQAGPGAALARHPPLHPPVVAAGSTTGGPPPAPALLARRSLDRARSFGASGPLEWSESVPVSQLVGGARAGAAAAGTFQLTCRQAPGSPGLDAPLALCVGSQRLVWEFEETPPRDERTWPLPAPSDPSGALAIVVGAPLVLLNSLPVPVEVGVGGQQLTLGPLQRRALHGLEEARAQRLRLRPAGYAPVEAALLSPAMLGALGAEAAERQEEIEVVELPPHPSSSGPTGPGAQQAVRWVRDTPLQLVEVGQSGHSVGVVLRHGLDPGSGARVLRLTCTLWIFNCTGQPLALRQAHEDAGHFTEAERAAAAEDRMPQAWLAPLALPPELLRPRGPPSVTASAAGPPTRSPMLLSPARGEAASSMRLNSATSSLAPLSRAASSVDVGVAGAGLGAALPREAGEPEPGPRLLGHKRPPPPRGWGIVEGVDGRSSQDRTVCWPALQGGLLQGGKQRLRLQLRASPLTAPPGTTFWSAPLTLDSQGGAAVVTVPSPAAPASTAAAAGGAARRPDRAAMVAAVTAGPVAGSGGVLALHLAPRYLLLNSLDAALQYRQQGTGAEAELGPGVSCPLRWADAGLPLRLCVRLQEAGWLWSGGFGLDSPGDTFIKVRHRDRGETMLLRVGVAAAAAGTLAVTLSHQPAGFAPYRLENCSLLTLHARQRRVREQQDVLRPYCSLGYAWDEPARPHQLVLELAGGVRLGTWGLDQVPQDDLVSSPLGPVRVVLRAEGPTRVLTLLDPMRHPFFLRRGAAGLGAPGAGALASVAPGGVGLAPASAGEEETAAASGLQWRVSASLAGVGLSAVVGGCEVAYARATRLAARLAVGPAHLSLGLESAALQLDDPRPRAAFPVVAALPAPRQGLAPRRVDDLLAGGERQAGLAAALTLWRRRPAGVLCVEDARLTCAPLALWLAQEHLEALAGAARVLGRAAGVGGGAGAPGSGGAQEVTGRRSSLGTSSEGGNPPPQSLNPVLSSPGVLQLLGGAPLALEADRKLFINLLALAPLRISLSFLPTPLGDGAGTVGPYRRLLSLAEVEDARIRLAALSLHRPLMGQAALGQLLQRHYARAILPEVYKILGSAAVFGDPIRLVHHLGLGVWSVLASPAAGLVESARSRGPAQLLLGLAEGPRAAAAHFAFALSNAAGKTTAAARKAMSALGLDRYTAEYPHRPRRVERDGGSALIWRSGTSLLSGEDQGPTNGRGEALLPATLRGLVGLVAEPAAGAETGGLLGAAHGLVKGSVGVVVLPLASALDMLARTAASVRLAVVGAPALGWTRPPRYVPAGAPLPAYVAEQALGRWLLLELEAAGELGSAEGGTNPAAAFVSCTRLEPDGGKHLVLTQRFALLVEARRPRWAPRLCWSAALEDLESVAQVGDSGLRLVAQRARRSALTPGQGRGAAPSPFSLSVCEIRCAGSEPARALHDDLVCRAAAARAARRGAWVGL
ncbi:hypothetical protein ACKKBF_B05705 [Auxenochlorella protothecoides x Auxenochlorella symbiontica]